ncbi:unnamed protein product [Pieris macdunnoughi]|uniref:NF-kappa-B-repressing factor n=1 Tax=Pieris macdunnoughi TaxID=345717 RepID=A0A821QWS6_9NEOP|nr:unnamed protein product [Pieris macdunnoughi]
MSVDVSWDVDKYREEYESEEHWNLRRAFIKRWKDDYPEERLVCLAQVFANIEFMGCRYPLETMQEVARLSQDIATKYRKEKKTKLQRTFVSASDAAEDRAKGIKREGGVIKDAPSSKSKKIEFVKQGESKNLEDIPKTDEIANSDNELSEIIENENGKESTEVSDEKVSNDVSKEDLKTALFNTYVEEISKIRCLDIRCFNRNMFMTSFGKFVLLIRSWAPKMSNIQGSSVASHLQLQSTYENNILTVTLNGKFLAQASSSVKTIARKNVETIAWNKLCEEAIILFVKEQWIAHEDRQISMSEVSGKKQYEFGTPIDSSVATKMMKLMGWKGGGLGADAQGIAEPIKPTLQMVNRAGLGSISSDIHQLRRKGMEMMKRFAASEQLDVDLVFSNEFSSEERSALHLCARKAGLVSRSYGVDADRFLVVKKKFNVFSTVEAVVEKGGSTPKYTVYIPASIEHR